MTTNLRIRKIKIEELDKRGRNKSGDQIIKPGNTYLALYSGQLHTVIFNEVWFGLSTPSMGFHAQYDPPGENCSRWESIWEIELGGE